LKSAGRIAVAAVLPLSAGPNTCWKEGRAFMRL
jgi:hypothetical protein